jgi:hypothetical protein
LPQLVFEEGPTIRVGVGIVADVVPHGSQLPEGGVGHGDFGEQNREDRLLPRVEHSQEETLLAAEVGVDGTRGSARRLGDGVYRYPVDPAVGE